MSRELLRGETEPCARTGNRFGKAAFEVRQSARSRIGLARFALPDQEAISSFCARGDVPAASLHFKTRNVPKGTV